MSKSVILCTAGYDHTIRFWEAPSGVCSRTCQFPNSQVNKIEIHPQKSHILAAGYSTISLYDVNSNNHMSMMNFEGHTGNVTAIQFGRQGMWFASSSEDGSIRIYDFRDQGRSTQHINCKTPLNSLALHANQRDVFVGDQLGRVHVWDLTAGRMRVECTPGHKEVAIRSVCFHPSGTLALATNNEGKCFYWPLAPDRDITLDNVESFDAHRSYILKALFSPDGRKLATCSADYNIRLWKVHDGLPGSGAGSSSGGSSGGAGHRHGVSVNSGNSGSGSNGSGSSSGSGGSSSGSGNGVSGGGSGMSRHGSGSSSGSGGGVVGGYGIGSSTTSDRFEFDRDLRGHGKWVWDAAFSVDSLYLVTGSSDQSAKLWDLTTSEAIRTFFGHQKAVTCVALNDAQ